MASQNSTLISSLTSANHPMMMQIGNGIPNQLLTNNQQQQQLNVAGGGGGASAANVFTNGIALNRPPPSTFINSGDDPLNNPNNNSTNQLSQQPAPKKPGSVSSITNAAAQYPLQPINESTQAFLMEKLHSKSSQMKTWDVLAKNVKNCLHDKRPIVHDGNDKLQLQRCLDIIQNNIEVKSVQSLIERLDTICRQLKLKFSFTAKNYEAFVSSDMYYVEIKLDKDSGQVVDCKIAHGEHEMNCPELSDILRKGNFAEFTKHLEGLSAIYQIDCDKKIKAYLALHALENDLSKFYEVQKNTIKDINNMIHKSPAGILEPRVGGFPMKLTYFVAPYDLIDLKTKTTLPLTIDTILERKLGYSTTVCIEESSSTHRIQIEPLVKLSDVKNLPQPASHSASNSTQLPASFVLKLSQPLPVCSDHARRISKVIGVEFPNMSPETSLISLMARSHFPHQSSIVDASRTPCFYAQLPDQSHCYYVNDTSDAIKGFLIERIPFTHPSHVPRILVFLRQQVLFNVILGSIIRQLDDADANYHIFEVSATDLNNIYVQFEHPIEQSLATLDIDLKDITNVKCKLYPSLIANICSDDYASKIMQKSLSIPVTMRSIINRTRDAANKLKEAQKRDTTSQANVLYHQNVANNGMQMDNGTTLLSNNGNVKDGFNQTNPGDGNQNTNKQQQNRYQQHQQQTLLSNQFGAKSQQQQVKSTSKNLSSVSSTSGNNNNNSGNTMLMSMLSDVPHAALQTTKQQQQQSTNSNKKRKRLSSCEMISPSSKHRRFELVGKQEPMDGDSTIKLTSSSELSSSSSISSSDNDLSADNSNQSFYSIKSGDDGLNEQLKIIKSLEEMSQSGSKEPSSSSTELPKLILKNDKSINSIKITKSQPGKSADIQYIEQVAGPGGVVVRKDRKRKRTNSLDGKDFSVLLHSSNSAPSTQLESSSSSSNLKSLSLVSSSTSGLSKLITQSSNTTTPPKLKKQNSLVGSTSSSTSTSPVTSPSIQSMGKNLSMASNNNNNSNIALKYSDKTLSKTPKQGGSGALSSMLTPTKMGEIDFEAIACQAVASGSQEFLQQAISSYQQDQKRYGKPVKAKVVGQLANNTAAVGTSTVTGGISSNKTSSQLSVTPTMSTTATTTSANSPLNKFKLTAQQSMISNTTASSLAASIKAKNSSSSIIGAATSTSAGGVPMSTPKQIQTSISSQPILQQSSSVAITAASSATAGTLLSAQKGIAKVLNKKASLTSVVDRLRGLNAGGEGSSMSALNSIGAGGGGTTSGPASSSTELSSVSSSSSSKPSSALSTLAGLKSDGKAKFSRNLDSQFTIKQSNSGLKMSITKTKPTAASSQSTTTSTAPIQSTAADLISKIGPTGLFKSSKYTIPKIPKTSQPAGPISLATISGAITSPTLSSTTSGPSPVSSSPSAKKIFNNGAKANLAAGKMTSPGQPRMSPKNSAAAQTKSATARADKVFKNPENPPPVGPFTKLGQPLGTPLNRPNSANALFKQNSPAFSMAAPSSTNWTSQSNTLMDKTSMMISSSSDLYSPNMDRISSSSDAVNKSPHHPTSTPSSPVESPSMCGGESIKNQPIVIPTEAIDEPGRPLASPSAENRLASADSSDDLYSIPNLPPTPKRKTSETALLDGKQQTPPPSDKAMFFPPSATTTTTTATKGINHQADSLPSSTLQQQNSSIITSEVASSGSEPSTLTSHLDAELDLIGSSDI